MDNLKMEMRIRPSWKNYVPHYAAIFAVVIAVSYVSFRFAPNEVWGNVIYLFGMLVILFVALKVLMMRFSECFTVREREVAMEHGILNKSSIEIGILQIRTIQVKQSLWQRIVNIGDLLIASAGTEGYEITAHGIDSPYELRDRIQMDPGVKKETEADTAD